ncbi:putative RNA-directed DNA polymerase from transposon BS [Trichonephila clavipes]|nr:putative RNA-directed DNA polymerase from transposon BS [Trichonephila clavipes]
MSWKTAVVIPILKPDKNSALAESYRPISLLPVLSKLAEKVILARLNDHLERENILIPEQHGFRPRLSTSHQLLRVVEFIKEGNNKDECTAAVFLDIQKAFDRSKFVELQMLSDWLFPLYHISRTFARPIRSPPLLFSDLDQKPRSLSRAFWTATAGSDVVQSGRPIFDDFFQHLWPYIGNNTANVVFQMVKRLWLIRIDQ